MAKATIRNRIRTLREAAGLTQSELAKHCACSRQTIIMLEQERYVPSLSLAFAIADALNAGIDAVFERESSTGPSPNLSSISILPSRRSD
jgi:putative transcriptional regulator